MPGHTLQSATWDQYRATPKAASIPPSVMLPTYLFRRQTEGPLLPLPRSYATSSEVICHIFRGHMPHLPHHATLGQSRADHMCMVQRRSFASRKHSHWSAISIHLHDALRNAVLPDSSDWERSDSSENSLITIPAAAPALLAVLAKQRLQTQQ